jgi:hypothetical protein
MFSFSLFLSTRWRTKSRNPVILSVIHHCLNPLEHVCKRVKLLLNNNTDDFISWFMPTSFNSERCARLLRDVYFQDYTPGRKYILYAWCSTFSSGSEVAVFHVLSSRILVTRGNRIEIPEAVWTSCCVNSAPVISQTGIACNVKFFCTSTLILCLQYKTKSDQGTMHYNSPSQRNQLIVSR